MLGSTFDNTVELLQDSFQYCYEKYQFTVAASVASREQSNYSEVSLMVIAISMHGLLAELLAKHSY